MFTPVSKQKQSEPAQHISSKLKQNTLLKSPNAAQRHNCKDMQKTAPKFSSFAEQISPKANRGPICRESSSLYGIQPISEKKTLRAAKMVDKGRQEEIEENWIVEKINQLAAFAKKCKR